MQRKEFLRLGTILAATASQGSVHGMAVPQMESTQGAIDFIHDGLSLTPKEYGNLLMKLADEGKIKPDYYSNNGVVEELEATFAKLLGKESAVFMPTGTLANHIAVRHLAGENRRVIVQEQSHLYNDTGDCAQTLSGLTLIPLGLNSVEFTAEEVEAIVKKTQSGRVETRIGAISIESPVRRQKDRMVRYETIQQLAAYAKSKDIRLHLDGARLFVQPVHNNRSVIEYCQPVDTVYTSLWKCFNAASGAILAGSKSFTNNLFHERRMFGGGLPAAWAFAAVALHFAHTFADDYKRAWLTAQQVFPLLQKDPRFRITSYEQGSHLVELSVNTTNLTRFREVLATKQIHLPAPVGNTCSIKINPSLNRATPAQIAGLFLESIK